MEPRNRNVWIVVASLLVIACGCALLAGMAGVGLITGLSFDLGGLNQERIERSIEVGDAPVLEVNSPAGTITIRPGEENIVHVVAVKKAPSRRKLERIAVDLYEREGAAVVQADTPPGMSNVTVELRITAPPDSRLKLETGAGTVDVRGIAGPTEIHCGAGTVDVRRAKDSVKVSMGAGTINYEGSPVGDCSFKTGAGTIILDLPADLDMEVDLASAIGAVGVEFDVDGQVSLRKVKGTIGDGSEGSIDASTGAGTIVVNRQ
jgi:DUF4097 and DUF4098 domain-containing protein YvlB